MRRLRDIQRSLRLGCRLHHRRQIHWLPELLGEQRQPPPHESPPDESALQTLPDELNSPRTRKLDSRRGHTRRRQSLPLAPTVEVILLGPLPLALAHSRSTDFKFLSHSNQTVAHTYLIASRLWGRSILVT